MNGKIYFIEDIFGLRENGINSSFALFQVLMLVHGLIDDLVGELPGALVLGEEHILQDTVLPHLPAHVLEGRRLLRVAEVIQANGMLASGY